MPVNEFGQPVGDLLDWTPGPPLGPVTLTGRTCSLEPLSEVHLDGLYAAVCEQSPDSIWTYLPAGPFADRGAFAAYYEGLAGRPDIVALAIVLPDGTPVGVATWLRIDRVAGTAEVGHLTYAAALQRTTASTEAMFLMAQHAFDTAGVRRYEWKCDALNEPSRAAAARLGFTYEGTFRQATHYKGRNRDTAWFAITDRDWPALREEYRRWLDPANFDGAGVQHTPLSVPASVS